MTMLDVNRLAVGSSGNAALETLLCMPIALLFLFVVTDAGIGLLESASLEDAVRTGVQAAAGQIKQTPFFRLSGEGELELISDAELSATARDLADRIQTKVLAAKHIGERGESASYRVEVAPVVADVDPRTGALLTGSSRILAAVSRGAPAAPAAPAPPAVPAPPAALSSAEFVRRELEQAALSIPSCGALLAGLTGAAAGSSEYLPQSVFFYVLVESVASGLNRRYAEQALGGNFLIRKQELIATRNFFH